MDRMVVHAQVDHSNSNAVPEPYDQWGGGWPRFSIKGKPVEFHVHRVRGLIAWQNGILLQQDYKIAINPRGIRLLRVHDEGTQHANHLLHGQVRVIEVSPFLMESEFVDEAPTWLDWVLAGPRRTIHVVRYLKSMPMHREGFGQMVINDDSDAVSLVDLNRWPGSAAVEAPQICHLARNQFLLYRLRNEMKLFHAPFHSPWQLSEVRSFDQNGMCGAGTVSLSWDNLHPSVRVHVVVLRLCTGKSSGR